jgi:hypothetical protein
VLWSLHLRCGITVFALSGALGPRRGCDPSEPSQTPLLNRTLPVDSSLRGVLATGRDRSRQLVLGASCSMMPPSTSAGLPWHQHNLCCASVVAANYADGAVSCIRFPTADGAAAAIRPRIAIFSQSSGEICRITSPNPSNRQ